LMADNQFSVRVPNALEGLMGAQQGYDQVSGMIKQRQVSAAREQAAQEIMQGGNPQNALARLMSAGDMQGAQILSQLGNTAFDQRYKTEMLGIAKTQANRKEFPPGYEANPAGGQRYIKGGPEDPATIAAKITAKEPAKLSGGEHKLIADAEDDLVNLTGTREALAEAKKLVPHAYTGVGAAMRGNIGANLPDWAVPDALASPKGGDATVRLNQLLSNESIQAMSAALKGATTDKEMFEFKAIMADPRASVENKIKAIEQMERKVALKEKISTDRMNQIRGRTYFKPQGGMSAQPAPPPATQSSAGGPVRVNSPQERDALPPGTQYVAPDGSVRTKQ
jgi:hypothetical protein